MSSTMKLYYYPFGGRASCPRLMLTYAQIPFEDVRIADMDTEMAAHPQRYPLKTVPVLEVDGRVLSQSHAIELLIAKRAGLLPSGDDDEMALAFTHELLFQIIDFFEKVMPTMGKEGDALKAAREKWLEETAIPTLQRVERIYGDFAKAPTGEAEQTFFLGEKPTLPDFLVYCIVFFLQHSDLDHVDRDLAAPYPRFQRAARGIRALATLQTFFETHLML
jgi:glutathione S-transferase